MRRGALLAFVVLAGCTAVTDPGGYEVCEGFDCPVQERIPYVGASVCQPATIACAEGCATNENPIGCAIVCLLGDLSCTDCAVNEIERCAHQRGCFCAAAARTCCRQAAGCFNELQACAACSVEEATYTRCMNETYVECIEEVAARCAAP